ncbi:MAG TPA: tetratricopeptide repeat protein [Steroidobacteraceae bacterium]
MNAQRKFCLQLVAFVLLGAGSLAALAHSIDYDPRRSTELRACDDHRNHGRSNEAKECYRSLLNDSNNLVAQAEAAWALNDIDRANRLFREAAEGDQRSAQPRVRWGWLFLDTHQHADALKLFDEALQIAPEDTYARLGMAHIYAERFEGESRTLIDQLLKQDDQLIDAHLLAARMALEEGRLDDADKSLDRAAKSADRQKLPPLEIYSLRAVLDLARADTRRSPVASNEWVARALAYNPHYGKVYEELAHFEVMRRRYREASALLQRAVEIQPDLWSAHAELGVNLLRFGDIEAARQQLVSAYSGDPYSPTTVNTLRLLERTGEFEVVTSSVALPALPGGDQKRVDLRVRLNRKESAVLAPYVAELAGDAIATFSQRYGFEPNQPITVELYPDHDDFAVRVAALPGIGLLGVTFGYLLAMDSPSGRTVGDFHWGTTLWHEMAHVFTLEATDHRVPRWLSEGISVFEEWRTGPTPGVVVVPEALMALRDGKFLPVAELDAGFIRPQYPSQVQVSYMQAGLVCLFIEQRWGFDRLSALLHQFTRDTSTQAAIEATFRMPSAEFDKQFDAFARARYATTIARGEEWQKLYQAVRKAVQEEHSADAIGPARQAIDIYPGYVANQSPYELAALALEKAGNAEEAIAVLLQYRKVGGWEPEALRQLVRLLDGVGRTAEANEVLIAINYVDPLNAQQHAQLGERLLAAGSAPDALREFQVLLALDGHDTALANFGLARAYSALGDKVTSRRRLLDALASAPHYKPAQDMLLQTIGERNRNE